MEEVQHGTVGMGKHINNGNAKENDMLAVKKGLTKS